MKTTLPQKFYHFNRSIKVSFDGGSHSSDTGEFVFHEFDEKNRLFLNDRQTSSTKRCTRLFYSYK